MNSIDSTFSNGPRLTNATLIDFWRWAFSDLCDDDIKGIFAEWMVRVLLGLPPNSGGRVSWANSDIILPDRTRIEVKASALWQSWKLVNEDGSRKDCPLPVPLNPVQVRFGGLRARTALSPVRTGDPTNFKSHFYVFCFQSQSDPAAWDAWDLGQWEFYMMSRQELEALKIGSSISLATLRSVRPPMSAAEFQSYAKTQLADSPHSALLRQ